MMRSLAVVATACTLAAGLSAQNLNPVYRANRTFYTSMWTTNPPEYTTAGQTVPAGTMHWRVFLDQGNQRAEPKQITGIGTWWQPSDRSGTFPQTIPTPEFRIYPTTLDAAGLVIPDVAQSPALIVPPVPMAVTSGSAFKSLTINLGGAVPVSIQGDMALCGVYPAGASSSAPGFFGYLPSASNQTYQLQQSFYGFLYPGGTLTHFNLGGARSSLWLTEDQPTIGVRANWALSSSHYASGYLGGAWGDAAYFSPLADASWAGWTDGRSPATIDLRVYADGMDGMLPILLFNFGPRFTTGFPFLGMMLEVMPADPLLTALSSFVGPIQNGRSDASLPLLSAVDPTLAGSYFGFEAVIFDGQTFQLVDSTQSVWIAH